MGCINGAGFLASEISWWTKNDKVLLINSLVGVSDLKALHYSDIVDWETTTASGLQMLLKLSQCLLFGGSQFNPKKEGRL